MDKALDMVYTVTGDLVGPGAIVPWWAWAATLVMIFGPFVAPIFEPEDERKAELRALRD